MVFYQSILFLGYLYAHTLSTRFDQHRQIQIHAAIILISFLALPVALPENTVPPTDSDPTFWLLWILFLAIGLPYFVVSTTAPLVQKWFANIGHHTSHDPYYLYAASNTGSLIALLSYPFLLEPAIGLANQKAYWSIGYMILCLLIAGCAFVLWKTRQNTVIVEDSAPEENNLGLYSQIALDGFGFCSIQPAVRSNEFYQHRYCLRAVIMDYPVNLIFTVFCYRFFQME